MNPLPLGLAVLVAGCSTTPEQARGSTSNPRVGDWSHQLIAIEGAAVLERGRFEVWNDGVDCYTTEPITAAFPFTELLPSWNLRGPEGASHLVELRVAGQEPESWSPWMVVGEWGREVPWGPWLERRTEFEGGEIAVDMFRSDRAWARAQLRVISAFLVSGAGPPVERIALCFSARGTQGSQLEPVESVREPAPALWQRRLDVPARSQRVEDPQLAARICSPTSVAMVLDYYGVELSTAEVAARLFDPRSDLYGNWPRNVQGAFSLGVPGYVTRFNEWGSVRRSIAAGRPLVISIGVGAGQLSGAPYDSTAGHLLVLVGFDAAGDAEVNDPAAATAEEVRRVYAREELERVWMARGGTAYVLLAPE